MIDITEKSHNPDVDSRCCRCRRHSTGTQHQYPDYGIVIFGPQWAALTTQERRRLGKLLNALQSHETNMFPIYEKLVSSESRIPLSELPAAIQTLQQLGVPIEISQEQLGMSQKKQNFYRVARFARYGFYGDERRTKEFYEMALWHLEMKLSLGHASDPNIVTFVV